ncbi:unnamed protein product, partial [marine sediment metagenome]
LNGGDGGADGKIKLGEIRAMYVQRFMNTFKDLISAKQLADALQMSNQTIYADMEREIPEVLEKMIASRRIKVDLMAGLEV